MNEIQVTTLFFSLNKVSCSANFHPPWSLRACDYRHVDCDVGDVCCWLYKAEQVAEFRESVVLVGEDGLDDLETYMENYYGDNR